METSEAKKSTVTKKPNGASLRVKAETRKRVLTELAKINKKTFGRKVRVDHLLNLLLPLLKPEHIQKLQEDSLSNSDRLEMKYKEHIKKFGPISKDEFLGVLLESERNKITTQTAAISEGKTGA